MEVLVPSVPKRLQVTPTMIDDFIIDPVMGAKIIMGFDLDAFQKIRLRQYWWTPDLIDSSGFSTAKTTVIWLTINLRCVVIGDQVCGVYYQTFSTGQETFWSNYRRRHHPIFAAQLGNTSVTGEEEGKNNSKGAACYHQFFKNGSEIKMPAPSWGQDAKTQASLRYNVIVIDEWTKIEGSSEGINKQIIGRLTRESRSKHHPVWCNHMLLSATAETPQHASYQRYKALKKRVESGEPTAGLMTFCFKDYSNQRMTSGDTFKEKFRIDQTLKKMQSEFTRDHYQREVLGLWMACGKGWYAEENIRKCIELGRARDLQVMSGRSDMPAGTNHDAVHFFMGVDPAPALGKKSDDGALAILRAMPRPGAEDLGQQPSDYLLDFVWGRKVRGWSARQWSGLIHQKHEHFSLSGIALDAGAGGQGPSIMLELKSNQQLIESATKFVLPICCPDDTSAGAANFLLTFFKRGDSTVEHLWPSHTMRGDDNLWYNSHVAFQEAFEHGMVALPVPYNERPREETALLTPEKDWALRVLSQGVQQLKNIVVAVKEDGSWLTTRNNALQFSALGKKDIAYAMMLAYVRFLIWLKSNEDQFSYKREDAGMCSAL